MSRIPECFDPKLAHLTAVYTEVATSPSIFFNPITPEQIHETVTRYLIGLGPEYSNWAPLLSINHLTERFGSRQPYKSRLAFLNFLQEPFEDFCIKLKSIKIFSRGNREMIESSEPVLGSMH